MNTTKMILQKRASKEMTYYLHIELDEYDAVEIMMLSTKEPEQKIDGNFGFFYDAMMSCITAITIDGTVHKVKNGKELKELCTVGVRLN